MKGQSGKPILVPAESLMLDLELRRLQTVRQVTPHSTLHEDGGTDELSLEGLSGVPASLTTHAALTTGTHGVGTGNIGIFSGFKKITVGATEPTDPDVGDLWVDTS